MKLITTSWDDGNLADFRLAELLEKYNIQGTFYIPRVNLEHSVMNENQLIQLSERFEIGGHTLNHVRIRQVSENLFESEIKGCYTWLQDLLGTPPVSFCFPGGVLNKEAIRYTLNTGFKIIRTTELLNPGYHIDSVVPTTIHVYPHSSLTYFKHLVKRINLKSLALYMRTNGSSDLLRLTEFYLQNLLKSGGCLHIWGHSWEIEQYNLWQLTEDLFNLISDIPEVTYTTNKDLTTYKSLTD